MSKIFEVYWMLGGSGKNIPPRYDVKPIINPLHFMEKSKGFLLRERSSEVENFFFLYFSWGHFSNLQILAVLTLLLHRIDGLLLKNDMIIFFFGIPFGFRIFPDFLQTYILYNYYITFLWFSWPRDLETEINWNNPLPIDQINTSVFLSSSPPQFCPEGREIDIDSIDDVISSAEEFIHIAVMDYSPTFLYTKDHQFWPRIDNLLRKGWFWQICKIQ